MSSMNYIICVLSTGVSVRTLQNTVCHTHNIF